jgi:hypothetical protein
MAGRQTTYPQACALLYDRLPEFDLERVVRALDPRGAHGCRASFAGAENGNGLVRRGIIALDQHQIEVVRVAVPADDQASRLALQQSLLSPEDSAALLGHRAYIH